MAAISASAGEPRVSVITIFLNEERFLAESVESVFSQTYSFWELLLVDDGSTDGSREEAQSYANAHPGRVRYLEHPDHGNRGMSASRNRGIAESRGSYLALLDGDDVWLPHKLERQVGLLDSNPQAGMVYGPLEHWYSWTGAPEDEGRDWIPPLGVAADDLISGSRLLPLILRDQTAPPGTCSFLVRRELVERLGGFDETFRGMYEDHVFYAKVCLHTSVFIEGTPRARYRKHPASCYQTALRKKSWQSEEDRYLEWLARYVERAETIPDEDREMLRSILRPYRHPVLRRAYAAARRLAGWNSQ